METSLPTPMTARVYVNLPEGNITYACAAVSKTHQLPGRRISCHQKWCPGGRRSAHRCPGPRAVPCRIGWAHVASTKMAGQIGLRVLPHRIHGAAIYGNMDPINIPPMLAYIPAPWILWVLYHVLSCSIIFYRVLSCSIMFYHVLSCCNCCNTCMFRQQKPLS